MIIVRPDQFDFVKFKRIKTQKKKAGNPGTRSKTRYKDIITAFDIETTRLREIEQSIMYIWQWAFDDVCIVGRTWNEFLEFAKNISDLMKENEKLVVMVHNLSFEFQFLKGIYHFGPEDVFCMDSRKILKCTMLGNIEFRCSYLHSNMSLKEYTEKMGAEHSKLSGEEFDYSKKRFPWTPLSKQELAYCVHDVIGLVEATKIEMQHDGDNLYDFPLTSTGYVRRDAKQIMHRVSHLWVKKQVPSFHVYTLLREAFRGGNTHANRYFAGRIIENVKQVDRSSSYPHVLTTKRYPNDAFYEVGAVSNKRFEEYLRMDRAMLFRIVFTGLKLKDPTWGCPYIPRDKCRNMLRGAYDNGRVLSADALEITLTDVDYRIIQYEYTWDDYYITDLCYTRYGMLPHPFRYLINKYYERKTTLKGIPEEELSYFRAKQKINSLYGLCAQDPLKPTIQYVDDEYVPKDEDSEEILMLNNKRRQLPNYQVGVWCTAWARWELEEAIKKVHETEGAWFVYTDTDSVKYIGDVDFSEYNEERIQGSIEAGSYAEDAKGKMHYMGVLEEEDEAAEFITLGAKKYAYTDSTGKLHITVAGVIKQKGAEELERHGGIESFKPSFIFKDAGGLEAVYNDAPEVTEYSEDGHTCSITSNVVLRDSEYTLGITNEYEYLLSISNIPVDTF